MLYERHMICFMCISGVGIILSSSVLIGRMVAQLSMQCVHD